MPSVEREPTNDLPRFPAGASSQLDPKLTWTEPPYQPVEDCVIPGIKGRGYGPYTVPRNSCVDDGRNHNSGVGVGPSNVEMGFA